MQYLDAISKMTDDLCSFPRQTIQYHGNPGLRSVLWRPTRPSRTNTQKRFPFHYKDWNAKVGSPEILEVTGKFGFGVENEVVKG